MSSRSARRCGPISSARTAIVAITSILLAACTSTAADHPNGADRDASRAGWPLTSMGLPEGGDQSAGQGQTIAVLDTGLAAGLRDDWRDVIAEPRNILTANSVVDDENGHGTEMSAIIHGSRNPAVTGIAPGAKVMPIVVARKNGIAASPDLAR